MNPVVTSRDEILRASRELIQQHGWSAVNIRSVATACGVSIGSIYNYFQSKADLIGATVESVWHEIFDHPQGEDVFEDTQICISWIFGRMQYGCKQYPGFFTLHSLGFMGEDKSEGKQRMLQTWEHMIDGLCLVLKRDGKIRPDAFHEQFTEKEFADVLFSLLLSALMRQNYDPSVILEIVRRTLY